MTEVWRTISGFGGYSASSLGRIRRDSDGYIKEVPAKRTIWELGSTVTQSSEHE